MILSRKGAVIAVGGLVYFIVGGVWGSTGLYERLMTQATGARPLSGAPHPTQIIGWLFTCVAVSAGVEFIVRRTERVGIPNGLGVAAIVGAAFVLTAHASILLMQRNPLLFAMEAGFQYVCVVLLGAWHGGFARRA